MKSRISCCLNMSIGISQCHHSSEEVWPDSRLPLSTVNLFLIKQIAGKPLVFLNCMLSYLEIINHYYLSKTLYYVDDMILQGKMCSKIQFQCSRPLTRCHVNAFNKIAIMVYNITFSLFIIKICIFVNY